VQDAQSLLAKWDRLRTFRAEVTRAIETVRASGAIGSSLQAEVEVAASGPLFEDLSSLGDDLRFVLITSAARLSEGDAGTPAVRVTPSPHTKCERCWHWRDDVGHDPGHPGLCGRCTANLYGAGEPRRFA
jgi:isoleucyl-tRNA synthetase